MPAWVKPSRVRRAIVTLGAWREAARSQSAMHLWPLLAILEAGVNKTGLVDYEEADEHEFWVRYGQLPGEHRDRKERGEYTKDLYVDPLVRAKKPADYPHRGPWTIRVRTFLNSWHAANSVDDNKRWSLSGDYARIFEAKVLRRNRASYRVPIVDLAAWLFREEEFPETGDSKILESRCRRVGGSMPPCPIFVATTHTAR